MKVLDMHCDTISVLLRRRRGGEEVSLRENKGHLDLERMKKSRYLLQNFALFVNTDSRRNPWEEVCALQALYQEELSKNADLVAPVLSYEDIARNESAGKISAMLTVEEGAVCLGEEAKLRKLYEMGVRMMTLTWNHPNEIGFPNLDSAREGEKDFLYTADREHGLTLRGMEFLTVMEELGMIIDVSHLSDAGFYDVVKGTKNPFVASHSNARSVCGCVRNLTDDMLRILGERGGCTGLNYCPDFLTRVPEGEPNPGTVEAIADHARHIANVGGVDILGLGSDFDGIDGHAQLRGAESMELLREALHKAGFTQGQLDKIFYQNVLRVYRDTLK